MVFKEQEEIQEAKENVELTLEDALDEIGPQAHLLVDQVTDAE